MWRNNEELGLEIGLDFDTYWSLTPYQLNKYINVYTKKQQDEINRIDSLNYLLGKYIAFAFNDVKHYPKKPFLAEETKPSDMLMSAEDMERQVRFNVIKLGGKINE